MKNLPFTFKFQTMPMPAQLLITLALGGLAVFVIMLLALPLTVAQEWLLTVAGKGADKAIDFAVLVVVGSVGIPVISFLARLLHSGFVAAERIALKIDIDAILFPGMVQGLQAGQAQKVIGQGDNIYIASASPYEPRQVTAEWVEKQIAENPGKTVISIPFRCAIGMVFHADGRATRFDRKEPPFASGEEYAANFANEQWHEYQKYVQEFREKWHVFSLLHLSAREMTAEQDRANYLQCLRAAAICFALLFACNFATAQKSVELRKYLGERCEMTAPAGEVFFKYEQVIISRKNDAKKPLTFSQLLASSPAFTDSDAGKLQRVYTRTDVFAPQPVAPEPPAQQPAPAAQQRTGAPAYDPVRPRNIDGTTNTAFMLPDSLQMERNIDDAKEKITGWKAKLWKMAKPVWGFVMWVFNSILVLLICFGGICRYVAKTAANESLMTRYGSVITGRWILPAHENAAVLLLYTMWIIFIILLIDVFLWLVWLNLPLWLLLFIWFPLLWMAEKFTNWAVPNVPMAGGGQQTRFLN